MANQRRRRRRALERATKLRLGDRARNPAKSTNRRRFIELRRRYKSSNPRTAFAAMVGLLELFFEVDP